MTHLCAIPAIVLALFLGMPSRASAVGKKYALLVGVKKYEDSKLGPLEFTENDVNRLAEMLGSAGYEVLLLSDSMGQTNPSLEPTKANFETQLGRVLGRCKREDLVLVALSGHGVQFQGKPQAYYCPRDARPVPQRIETLVALEELYQRLDECRAGAKLLLVDACRSDPKPGTSRGLDGTSLDRPPPRGVYALFSCSAGEQAFEHKDLEHGVFFHFVLAGLRGGARNSDEQVSFDSLAQYVRRQVPRLTARLFEGAKQTPSLRTRATSGESPVIVSFQDEQLVEELQEYRKALLRGKATDFIRERGKQRATAWKTAAERGSDIGALLHGHALQLGAAGSQEPQRAVQWLRAAAESGLDVAQNALGVCYRRGDGVKPDEREAIRWYCRASEQGLASAQNNLGWCYNLGHGVNKDAREAVRWYRKAALQGLPAAQFNLAWCFEGGRGVELDHRQAVQWYRRAAVQGYARAQYNLGACYGSGRGVEKDPQEALRWIRRSAGQGLAKAPSDLGYCPQKRHEAEIEEKEASRPPCEQIRKAILQRGDTP